MPVLHSLLFYCFQMGLLCTHSLPSPLGPGHPMQRCTPQGCVPWQLGVCLLLVEASSSHPTGCHSPHQAIALLPVASDSVLRRSLAWIHLSPLSPCQAVHQCGQLPFLSLILHSRTPPRHMPSTPFWVRTLWTTSAPNALLAPCWHLTLLCSASRF